MSTILVTWQIINRFGLAVDHHYQPDNGAVAVPPGRGDIVTFPDNPSFYKVVRRIWASPLGTPDAPEPRQILILHIRELKR